MSAQKMLIAAARVLATRHAEACNVNADDVWNLHAEDFKADARAVLDAIGAVETREALLSAVAGYRIPDAWLGQARAALVKTPGGAA